MFLKQRPQFPSWCAPPKFGEKRITKYKTKKKITRVTTKVKVLEVKLEINSKCTLC